MTYHYADADAMYVIGNLNSRIANKSYVIPEVDNVQKWITLDIHAHLINMVNVWLTFEWYN